MIDNVVRDPQSEARFLATILPMWTTRRHEAYALAADFEREMSPAALMNQVPLRGLPPETRKWLEALTHDLWRKRIHLSQHLEHMLAAIAAVDASYERLLTAIGNRTSIEELRTLRDEFDRFEGLCQELSKALGALPSKILIT